MQTSTHRNTRAEQARINGAKSHGATTKEGQEKAKQGNYKHGAYAIHTTVLAMESLDAYNSILADAKAQYQPRNFFETQFVEEIVDLTWQIGRLKALITAYVNEISVTRGGRVDQALLAAETDGSTHDGPITVLERRIKNYINQRAKIMADLDRLKKIPVAHGPSQAVEVTVDFAYTFAFQQPGYELPVDPETVEDAPEQASETEIPPEDRSIGDAWM